MRDQELDTGGWFKSEHARRNDKPMGSGLLGVQDVVTY